MSCAKEINLDVSTGMRRDEVVWIAWTVERKLEYRSFLGLIATCLVRISFERYIIELSDNAFIFDLNITGKPGGTAWISIFFTLIISLLIVIEDYRINFIDE